MTIESIYPSLSIEEWLKEGGDQAKKMLKEIGDMFLKLSKKVTVYVDGTYVKIPSTGKQSGGCSNPDVEGFKGDVKIYGEIRHIEGWQTQDGGTTVTHITRDEVLHSGSDSS